MKCAVCYERFFTPKTQDELEKIYKENIKNNDYDEFMKFTNLLITPKHNETYTCPTPSCECLICRDCWIKITSSKRINKVEEEEDEDEYDEDATSDHGYFQCPYCRQIDWKDCMNTVFIELRAKVFGEDVFTITKTIYRDGNK
jgi:hypothetical protein